MRNIIASLVLASVLLVAAAQGFPSNGTILITAQDGTIVGIGKAFGGEAFELDLLLDFSGFGTLVFTTPEGTTHVFEVMISGGKVAVELTDLTTLLSEAGFSKISIGSDDSLSGKPVTAGRPESLPQEAQDGMAGAEEKRAAAAESQPELPQQAQEGMAKAEENRAAAGAKADEGAAGGAGNAGQGSGDADEGAAEGTGNAEQGSENADEATSEHLPETPAGADANPGYGPGNTPAPGGRP